MENFINYKKEISKLTSSIKFNLKNKFIPGKTYIPSAGKIIDRDEVENMIQASMDGWLTTGRFNKDFEFKLANFLDIKNLITVNSGSSANLVALSSLFSSKLGSKRIKPGDEIITVAAGFPTTINPIIHNGCVPVFVDVFQETYNINFNLIRKAITRKTKCIMIAHTLGNPFNLREIKKICEEYELFLVEDNCDALGSKYKGQLTGSFGDIATLSFYPAHHITMGEGGAVFTNSIRLKKIAESIRDWGRDCYCETGCDNTCGKRYSWQLGDLPYGYDHKFTYSHLGYNLKITDMQAACGVAQINKLEKFISTRKENHTYYKKNLSHLSKDIILPEPTEDSDPSWFGFAITLKNKKIKRYDLLKYLEEKKIGSRLLFGGNITKQPYFKGLKYKIASKLTVTDNIMNNTFWIGIYPGINKKMQNYVIENIEYFLNHNS
jgi:CDP-4-dehydro-6-deoxyglucose reductase, E1